MGTIPLILLLFGYYSVHVDPLNSKLFPLLAYSLPYVFLVNGIAVLYLFIIKKWKIAVFNIILVLLGSNLLTRIFALGTNKDILKGDLKILSYNLHSFNVGDEYEIPREIIRDSIFSFITDANADVYCFQEFFHENRKRKYVTLQQVIDMLPAKHVVSSTPEKTTNDRYSGCFIFSRYPIINHGLVTIQTNAVYEGKCLFADIQLPSMEIIRVYNFHLASIRYMEPEYEFVENLGIETKLNDESKMTGMRVVRMFLDASRRRSKELEFVLDHAVKSPYPTILCGDLNDTPTSHAYQRLREGYLDAFQEVGWGFGKTYSGRMPSNRIDYIFHSTDFEAIDFSIQNEVLSDHKAIIANLRPK